jgi:hypothetical protein
MQKSNAAQLLKREEKKSQPRNTGCSAHQKEDQEDLEGKNRRCGTRGEGLAPKRRKKKREQTNHQITPLQQHAPPAIRHHNTEKSEKLKKKTIHLLLSEW